MVLFFFYNFPIKVAGGNPRPLMTALILLRIFSIVSVIRLKKKRQVHMQIELITMFSRCIDSAETTVFDPSAEKEPTHCGFVLV